MLSKNIKRNIQAHKDSLEEYPHYRDELGGSKEDKIADLIENCDWESEDFNVGFEQGFIRGMESVLQEVEAEEKDLLHISADDLSTLSLIISYVEESEYQHWEEEDKPEHHIDAMALRIRKIIESK